jgi:hypothetical protein
MFKKYKDTDRLTLREQKELNKVASIFLALTTFYWIGVGTRLVLFWMEVDGKLSL